MSDPKPVRPELAAVLEAQHAALDEARPDAVAKQHARGGWTIRESIGAFLDPGSFVEYGRLARPARPDMTGPADGLVMGTGMVDGGPVCVMGYDYSVHAGTQSAINHAKASRIFELARARRWPVVCWAEGGGARPHDSVAMQRTSGFVPHTFISFAQMSGLVPRIVVAPGRAFAGQANLSGLSDILIATKRTAMGMAGPPLVEAALGVKYAPEEIGPVEVHVAAGAVDILVEDDAAAAAMARQCLGYFRGPAAPGPEPDVERLRAVIPENPRRAYDVRKVIEGLADVGSVVELRPKFGRAMVTAFARIEGRPVGILANQPMFLAGAIDSPASDKAARFISLCDAFDIPMLILCDTPGLMVGPEIETTALVRHSARILMALANATVPILTVVLRKAYGLGYYILGSPPLRPTVLLAWPTAEFGGMGIEGAVNIIYRKELEAEPDSDRRAAMHREFTEQLKIAHTALAQAGRYALDDVIDPADTRLILAQVLRTCPPPPPRTERKHWVDAW